MTNKTNKTHKDALN